VRFSPDGSRLYASGFGRTAIFDTTTGELVGEIGGDGILSISPDGASALIRQGRTAVRIVDFDDPSADRVIETPALVIDGAFSPDGDHVVTIAGDGAWLWSADDGVLRESLYGHVGDVSAVGFLPSGELVTAGHDGAVITWAMGDWSESFRDRKSTGSELTVPRDDRTLVSELLDGTFVAVAADQSVWRERACAVAGRSLDEEEWRAAFGSRPYQPACGISSVARAP
jgi:WD40 repeat protein